MPRHDPITRRHRADAGRAAEEWSRYVRSMRWMAPASAAAAGLSLLWLWRADGPLPLPALIATLLGVGLIMLVGTALVGLVFFSSRSGHDDEAGRGGEP